MDLTSPSQNFLNTIRSRGYAANKPTSTFDQNLTQALNIGIYENMSNSSTLVMNAHKGRRLQTLLKAHKDGTIPNNVMAGFRTRGLGPHGIDADALARYSKKHYNLDVMTDRDIKDSIREDLKIVKTSYTELQSRAGLAGKVGGVTGSVIPYALDPILLPSWFVGYGEAATGARLLAGLGKVVGVEAGLEAASQVFQYQWKDEVSEASLKESITSVATVAGVVGGLGVTAIGLAKGIRRLLRQPTLDTEGIGQSWAKYKVAQMGDEMAQVHPPKKPSIVEDALDNFETEFGFKPKIEIYETFDDVPEKVKKVLSKRRERAKALGATGQTKLKGVRTKEGTYHVVASSFKDTDEALRTIWHESVGHEFAKTLKPGVLDKLYLKKQEALGRVGYYGIDVSSPAGKRKAAEEYLVRYMTANLDSAVSKKATGVIEKKTALQHARELQETDAHLNQPHRAPDHTEGLVRNVTHLPETEGEIIDAATVQILKESPDMEIGTLVKLEGGEEKVITVKAAKLLEEMDSKMELANKYKECIT